MGMAAQMSSWGWVRLRRQARRIETECGKGNPNLPGNGGVVALNGMTGARAMDLQYPGQG